ncbi:MAG: alcohol dehydrogenase catalytic domain-containing protein [Candidatus Geothermincolales bacterium]
MKALTFEYSVPRYLLTGLLAKANPSVTVSGLAPVGLREVAEPEVPGEDWVKLRPILSGLCGSDMSIVLCRESLTLQPFASYPFVLGHEVCARIVKVGKEVAGFREGDRVVVMPMLGCIPRKIEPPCPACASGRYALCENFTRGSLPPGMFVGSNRATPGFISEAGVAHVSQLYGVPDEVTDENAVLVEPFSVALHMVVWNRIREDETLLVYGCGVMGLCTVAAIKLLHPGVRVLAVEPNPLNARLAREFGAEEVIKPGGEGFYRKIAELTGAKLHKPLLAQPILSGGVDRVFDTVGNTETVNSSLRVIRGGGWYNLLGIGEVGRVDWTPVWLKELTVRGVYGYKGEPDEEALPDFDAFAATISFMREGKVDLSRLVTHRFKLEDWRKALMVALNKAKYGAVKIVFHVDRR